MSEFLYLDNARLGRMSPSACRAHLDFTKMAGQEGSSLAFDRFLRCGEMPSRFTYPGLTEWQGVNALRQSLRNLTGSSPELPVLLANRSAQLMKLAGRLLCNLCRNVLVTDLGWPPYHDILAKESCRSHRKLTVVPVCESILEGRITEEEVIERVCTAYEHNQCDGLFLTAVSHSGLCLPVEKIVRRLENRQSLWFSVVDGAQDFCHVGPSLGNDFCDLYLASAHKWLGAYHPMGLGFFGRRRSKGIIETFITQMQASGELDDPLLRFVRHLDDEVFEFSGETVNLGSLFSCQGAAHDMAAETSAGFQNSAFVAELAQETGWRPLLPQPCFRSRILLLQATRLSVREADPQTLRADWHLNGVAMTSYPSGIIRLSMPNESLRPNEIDLLRKTFLATA